MSTALAFLIALLTIAALEGAIYIVFKPTFWERTSWLLHDPYKGEPFDRLVLSEKLKNLGNSKPDIITVGDSSGFFSLHPGIINRNLDGQKLVNISTGANQAFDGYFADAEYMLKRNQTIRHVVLYMHPFLVPVPTVIRAGDLGPIVATQINSAYGEMAAPPSALFSRKLKAKLFANSETNRDDPLSSHLVYLQLRKSVHLTLGWMPEHDVRFPRLNGNPGFWSDRETGIAQQISIDNLKILTGLRDPSSIHHNLTRFAELCRMYGAKPVIVFNPIPPYDSSLKLPIQEATAALNRFSKDNPDVLFPLPYITIWDSAKFGMFNHVSREYVHLSSIRLGRALAKIGLQPSEPHPFVVGQFPETDAPASVRLGQSAPATEDEKTAALSYFLYTATGNERYRLALSGRVKSVIQSEPGFELMMGETRRRIDELAADSDKIALGYDTSQLRADVVDIEGMKHCNGMQNIKWIQLSGTMNFTYKSRVHDVAEPVSWPHSSSILVPIVIEDHKPKFDGYCSEKL